jgi:GTP cyclohydrolase I
MRNSIQDSGGAGPLPDVAAQFPSHRATTTIDWVGMEGIALPILFDGGDGEVRPCAARADFLVNLLDSRQRGIHMSRLYLLLDEQLGGKSVDARALVRLLRAAVQSQQGLADRARLRLCFDYLVRRRALRTDHHGWRAYPVSVEASLADGELRRRLGVEVLYSSTCPASAALARQLAQARFAADFPPEHPLDPAAVFEWLGSEAGMVATPHAQRSVARVEIRLRAHAPTAVRALIDRIEHALGTPVQTAVKREDEQAFALANGQNAMFCEDALRRIRDALDGDDDLEGFRIRVEHRESLHAHDAVASISRNLPDCSDQAFAP